MKSEALTEERIAALARESRLSEATVRKFFEHGTRACSVATNRAIWNAALKLGISLELVDEDAATEK